MSSWEFNGKINSLKIFLYQAPTVLAQTTSDESQHKRPSTSPHKPTAFGQDKIKAEPSEEARSEIGLAGEDDNDSDGSGPDDYPDCYEDIFRGALPWNDFRCFVQIKQENSPSHIHRSGALDPSGLVSASRSTSPFQDHDSGGPRGPPEFVSGGRDAPAPLSKNKVILSSRQSYPGTVPEGPLIDGDNALGSALKSLGISYECDTDDDRDTLMQSQIEPGSPCPRRRDGRQHINQTGRVSTYFARPHALANSSPWPGQSLAERGTRLNKFEVLDRSIENPPRHSWSGRERALLCVIQRWFTFSREWDSIVLIFNKLTNNNLLERRIRRQWESLVFFSCHPIWKQVYDDTPFEDSEGVFKPQRTEILACARQHGIEFQLKATEDTPPRGAPWLSQSPHIRRQFDVFQKQKRDREFTPQIIDASYRAMEEIDQTDTTNLISSSPLSVVQLTPPSYPSTPFAFPPSGGRLSPETHPAGIAYRVHDKTKQSPLVPNVGFRSSFFYGRKRGVTNPLPPDHDLLDAFAEKHFWEHAEGVSPFVSVSTSLLFAVLMAKRSAEEGHNPSIATIDLSSLKDSIYSASAVIRRVKRKGDLPEMRYKGSAELLIWGEIPDSAIVNILPYTELEHLTTAEPAIGEILRLGQLKPEARVYYLHQDLMEDPVFLSPATTTAIAQLADHFGLGLAPPAQLAAFIHSLIDGFAVDATQVLADERLMHKLGISFLNALNRAGQDDEALISAFINGVRTANEILERSRRSLASRSRSRSGRRKTTRK
ncbi:hypothetical protein BU16DRAFT_189557 [Lophium mytilinum]|uniref:DUF7587 domain-containing protein n=1 Tax=Lophium mytilinum TaxID=390894 RepID=A0A6A6R8T5_9PEZI|nr:hypothetical protein BU16DRAFT_189557 [Lophium mytilinum]